MISRQQYLAHYYQENKEFLKTQRRKRYRLKKVEPLAENPPCPVEQLVEQNPPPLIWVTQFCKYVFYSCPDSCWKGKYCNNCFFQQGNN